MNSSLHSYPMRLVLLVSLTFVCSVICGFAVPAPEIDLCNYSTDASARANWRPMQGSEPVSIAEVAGSKCLRLPCRFTEGKPERAYWDRKLAVDLSHCREIEFKIYCRDASPVSYFNIYFQSGNGWYHDEFYPESTNQWNTIRMDRAKMKAEGTPAGWDQVKTIRISGWRAQSVDTEFYIRDLRESGVLGVDLSVAVIRLNAASKSGRPESDPRFAEHAMHRLEAEGIDGVVLDEEKLTLFQLRPARLVILPGTKSVSGALTNVVGQYLDTGGMVLFCTPVAEAWQGIIRAHTNNHVVVTGIQWTEANPRRGLLFATGYLLPDVWLEAARRAIEKIHLESAADFKESTNLIAHAAGAKNKSQEKIRSAATERAAATKAFMQRNLGEALDHAGWARAELFRAFYQAQAAESGEFRGFWCHNAFGVDGFTWDEAIHRLAQNGFTAIFPNMLWGGAAFYDSQVLPVADEAKKRGDQIRECLAACRKYGVQMHVWKVDWNLGRFAPESFVEKMRGANRLQVSATGKEEPWLCPSHPENQDLEIRALLEVVRNYDVDGIHFDYIRYPDKEHCFCSGCRERFEYDIGKQPGRWPEEVLSEGPIRQQFLEWRRNNITTVVKAVSERARRLKPKIKISAAVFRYWPTDRDIVGQDWKLWCDQGFLDFVCPMDYTESNHRFETMIAEQVKWAGKTPCYPGIGVSASSSRLGPEGTIGEILTTRRYQTHGFLIFNYGRHECSELLPLLGMGITARTGQ